jgi:hypothetical protein
MKGRLYFTNDTGFRIPFMTYSLYFIKFAMVQLLFSAKGNTLTVKEITHNQYVA